MIGYEGAPRYPRQLQALTGDTEIVPPGLVLEQDRPEWKCHRGERIWTTSLELVAATVPTVGVFVTQPNGLSIISGLLLISLEAAAINMKFGIVQTITHDSELATGTGDVRAIPLSRITRAFKRNQAASSLASAGRIAVNTGYTVMIPGPFVLVQGWDFIVELTAGGTTSAAYIWGYERTMRPEETVLT